MSIEKLSKMRKLVVLLGIIMTVRCSEGVVVGKTPIEIMQKSIEEAIKKDMNDPSSFQFLSLQITNRVKVGKRKEFANEDTLNDLKNNPYSTQDFIDQIEAEVEHLKGKSDYEGAIIFVDYKIRRPNTFGDRRLFRKLRRRERYQKPFRHCRAVSA